MIKDTLDNQWVRIGLRAFFGVPFTLMALVGSVYGFLLLVGGIQKKSLWAGGLGVGSVLGLVGLVGAWWRLLKPHKLMSCRERLVVRALRLTDVLSGVLLPAISWFWWQWAFGSVFCVLIAAAGAVLVAGTPSAL